MRFSTRINGVAREIDCDPGASLFEVLRGLGYKSVKQGCDREGMCGACTVLVDGQPLLSCITPAPKVAGREVTSVEALGHPGEPHPLQTAFVDAGAVQCGFCTPGVLLTSKALLDKVPDPTAEQINEALAGHLCRCTGYVKITQGVRDGAALLKKKEGGRG